MKVVIIGGEAAGMSAAAKARRINPEAEIVVYEASEIISFGACGLPYFVGDEFQDHQLMAEFTPKQFTERGIEVKISHRVLEVLPDSKQVIVDSPDGKFTTTYDELMIATGAQSALPPVDGLDLQGVYSLKTMADGLGLKAEVEKPSVQHVTVIGSGFIGLEMVESLVNQGKSVRLIERADHLIPDAFDPEISRHLYHELSKAGVDIHLSESLSAITASSEKNNRVQGIITNKDNYATDVVVVATGVKPNTEFLASTGIETLKNGAIKIDHFGKTSLPHVWAAGDCASIPHAILKQDSYIPLATGANKLGRIVGENMVSTNMTGDSVSYPGSLATSAIKVLEIEAGRTGISEKEAINAGLAYNTVFIRDQSHTNYYRDQSDLYIKLVYHAETKQMLGAQMVGRKGAVHRIDALAVAISAGMTTEHLGMMDFAYAPPFARTWDIMNVAGNVAK